MFLSWKSTTNLFQYFLSLSLSYCLQCLLNENQFKLSWAVNNQCLQFHASWFLITNRFQLNQQSLWVSWNNQEDHQLLVFMSTIYFAKYFRFHLEFPRRYSRTLSVCLIWLFWILLFSIQIFQVTFYMKTYSKFKLKMKFTEIMITECRENCFNSIKFCIDYCSW